MALSDSEITRQVINIFTEAKVEVDRSEGKPWLVAKIRSYTDLREVSKLEDWAIESGAFRNYPDVQFEAKDGVLLIQGELA